MLIDFKKFNKLKILINKFKKKKIKKKINK